MASVWPVSSARVAGATGVFDASSQASTADPAPWRICVPSERSSPDMRVWAVNETTVASPGSDDRAAMRVSSVSSMLPTGTVADARRLP